MPCRTISPRRIVYRYFMNWRSDGTFQRFDDRLRAAVRTSEGRDIQPTDAILNSQKVKTLPTNERRCSDG